MNEAPVDLASEALRRLRRAMSGMEAPPTARSEALAAYRDRHSDRRRRTLVWAVAAVAACAVLAVVGVRFINRAPAPAPVAAVATAPLPPAPAIAKTVEPKREPRPGTAKPRAHAVLAKRKPAQPAPPAEEVATDFLPIPFAPPLDPAEGGQVIRVRLPRSAMRTVGLPVDNGWRDRVPADVVVGGDGIARAVRFVGFTK